MLHGKVRYGFEDGRKVEKDWAARAELVRDEGDGEWRLGFYQVYLVSELMGGLLGVFGGGLMWVRIQHHRPIESGMAQGVYFHFHSSSRISSMQ